MCIDYNHLIGTLLEFISNSWNDIKASEYSNNTIFRTYCCGEMETISCCIILKGIKYKVEYNILDCEVSLSADSDYSFSYQKKIYNAIYKQVIAPLIEFHQ